MDNQIKIFIVTPNKGENHKTYIVYTDTELDARKSAQDIINMLIKSGGKYEKTMLVDPVFDDKARSYCTKVEVELFTDSLKGVAHIKYDGIEYFLPKNFAKPLG